MTDETGLITLAKKAYAPFNKVGNLMQPLVLLAFRLAWGFEFYKSGIGKIKNHADIVSFFSDLHIPFPDLNAWFVGGLECVGGILLIVGLAARPVGLLLAINMTVAYLAVKDDRELVFNMLKSTEAYDAFTKADPYFYWLTAVVVFAFGAGAISLDKVIEQRFIKRPRSNGDT